MASRTLPSAFARRRTASGLSTPALSITRAIGTLFPGGLDGLHGRVTVDIAGPHQHSDAALDQLGVMHVHIHHHVLVHIAEPCHGAGCDHIGDHFLRRGSFHASGSGDHFRPHFGDNRNLSGSRKRRVLVACDRRGVSSATPCVFHRTYDVGGPSGRGEADHNVLARGAAAGDVALAKFGRIFIYLHCRGDSLGTASNDVLHRLRRRGVGGGHSEASSAAIRPLDPAAT